MSSDFQVPSATRVAGGTIYGGRFVTLSTTADFTVSASTTGDSPYGISMLGNRTALVDYLAIAGDGLGVYTDGQTCWLQLNGTVAAGDFVKPSTDGKGITSAGGVGAIALQSGTVDSYIKVQVHIEA